MKDNYWHKFHMQQNPFSEEADHEVCYLSLQWKQYLEFLAQVDNYQEALVIVTGEPGVGKTTLLFELVKQLPKTISHHVFYAEDCASVEQLLQIIEDQFNAPVETDMHLNIYDKANQQLTQLQQINKRHLLLIDNADQLPLDVQQILLHIMQQQLAGHVVLQVILFGDQDIVESMQHLASQSKPEESKHIVNTLTLDPFDADETREYLFARFAAVGYKDNTLPFSDRDFEYIYRESEGIAVEINDLTESVMRGKNMEHQPHSEPPKSGTPLLKRYIWWGCTIVVIAILLIWVLPMLQSKSTSEVKPLTLPQQTAQDANNPNPDYMKSSSQRYQKTDQATQTGSMDQSQTNQSQANQVAATSQQATITAPDSTQKAEVEFKTTLSHNTAAQIHKTHQMNSGYKSVPKHQLRFPEKTVKHDHLAAAVVAKQNSQRATRPELTMVEQQLLKINPHYYTIQLVGYHDSADVQKFMRQHHLQDEAVYFHTYFQRKDWYVVISGDYASYAQASAAKKQLPADLQRLNPWIRSFASVHKSITMQP